MYDVIINQSQKTIYNQSDKIIHNQSHKTIDNQFHKIIGNQSNQNSIAIYDKIKTKMLFDLFYIFSIFV